MKEYVPSPTIEDIAKELGISVGKVMKADSGENPYVPDFTLSGKFKNPAACYYPDPSCKKLREKLSKYMSVSGDRIVCGNGSDELIDLLIRIFISKGDEIIVCPPTFSMYGFYGILAGAAVKEAVRDKESLKIDAGKISEKISEKTKMIFIDSPGNPTSALADQDEIEMLLKRKVIVTVDEAYFEYCGKTVLPLIQKYPNLVILRTFSKWAGLAGLRIGYAVGDKQLIETVNSIRPPYNVNSFAQKAACTVLDNRQIYLDKLKKIISRREKSVKLLSAFPDLYVYPTEGAYILISPKSDAKKLQSFLRKEGILLKLINSSFLKNTLRMNLLGKKELQRIISALGRYYGKKIV